MRIFNHGAEPRVKLIRTKIVEEYGAFLSIIDLGDSNSLFCVECLWRFRRSPCRIWVQMGPANGETKDFRKPSCFWSKLCRFPKLRHEPTKDKVYEAEITVIAKITQVPLGRLDSASCPSMTICSIHHPIMCRSWLKNFRKHVDL
jgi:hypothetical protein